MVSIILVSFNSIRYLPEVFQALKKQTYQNLQIIVIDNNSDVETKTFLKNQSTIELIENTENTGFAIANNQGIERARGDFVLCLNHDVVLEEDYIEKCVRFLRKNEKAGAVSGYIKKWDFNNSMFTEKVDTLGFKIFKNHKVIDQDIIEFDTEGVAPVFGVSAAVAMYRRSAIDELIRISGHFFDGSFESYKEDVDVAYRLLHAGFKSFVLRDAIAYHDRWETGSGRKSVSAEKEARKAKPEFINRLSYQNHLAVLVKNEFILNLLIYAPFIIFFELQKLVFYAVFERSTLRGLFGFMQSLTLTLQKRRDIFKSSRISPADISEWLR